MSADISLFDLVNLSIGTPEPGAVQFNALHTLLHALIKHLNIQDVKTEWVDKDASRDSQTPPGAQAVPREKPSPYHHMEGKLRHIENQISALERLPSGTDLLSRSASGTATPVKDMWQLMQLQRKVQANEDGVSKCMGLIQDLMKEIQELKETRDSLKTEVKTLNNQLTKLSNSDLSERVAALEQCCQLVEDLEKNMRGVCERLGCYPDPEEMTQFVTWEVMQHTLVGERQSMLEEVMGAQRLADDGGGVPFRPFHPFLTRRASSAQSVNIRKFDVAMGNLPSTAPALPAPSDCPAAATLDHADVHAAPDTAVAMAPSPPGDGTSDDASGGAGGAADDAGSMGTPSVVTVTGVPSTTAPTAHPADSGLYGELLPPPSAPCLPEWDGPALDVPLSRVSSGALRYPETLSALRAMAGLGDRLASLEARVEELEKLKADQARLDELREAVADMGERDIPNNQLMEEMSHMKDLVDTLLGDKDKRLAEPQGSTEIPADSVRRDSETLETEMSQIRAQLGYLRTAVRKLEDDVQLLKREGASRGEERRRNTSLQEQLDKLRSMLEDMMASSSSMLARSLNEAALPPRPSPEFSPVPHLDQSQNQNQNMENQNPEQGQAGGCGGARTCPCPSCSVDLTRQVSQLFQRYARLQDTVNTIAHQKGGARIKLPKVNLEDADLVTNVQGAILQLQAECEKLQMTTHNLMEEHSQKQTHIDHLYKSVEVLDEKKADRELVEMEIQIKADKRALESKVSRLQFDAMTEQLSGMFQELLSKVSLQEQDWHKVIDKISMEMECKLNRLELDPLKKQLEDRWRSIRKKLQDQPAPEHSDAAGIRKQLVARFHCISCDRPVDMLTPGPNICPIPSSPGLHVHKSSRPYTVFELEQIRQHCRSLQPGTNQSHFEMACVERSLVHVQRLHTHLCQQLERAQSHLAPPNARYHNTLTPLPRTWSTHPPIKVDRVPELVEHSSMAISRSCGGSHTLTYPHRRYTRLQHITHLIHAEHDEDCNTLRIQPEEVDILGLDGHIYKGRLNALTAQPSKSLQHRLPVINPKEGKSPVKQKLLVPLRSAGDVARVTPVRPQSAKTQRSRSASSSTMKDRPLSSIGCMSRDTDQPQDTLQLTVDLTQSEDEPVTSL